MISDLVFTCRYNKNGVHDDKSRSSSDSEAKVVLLVEHQSTPDRFMAFRVYHYLFNMLYTILKKRPKDQASEPLPPVYALVFYHGKQTPYPYSMDLANCFNDPFGIMDKLFNNPVPLVDVNSISDDKLKQQALLGIITGALKYSRSPDMGSKVLWLMEYLNSMDLSERLKVELVREMTSYMFSVGTVANVKQFVKNIGQLPEPIRGEFMTAAEQLQELGAERGREEGLEKGKKEVAINLLKEGVEPRLIARTTGLGLASILELKEQLEK